jgi:hypothetical protein
VLSIFPGINFTILREKIITLSLSLSLSFFLATTAGLAIKPESRENYFLLGGEAGRTSLRNNLPSQRRDNPAKGTGFPRSD